MGILKRKKVALHPSKKKKKKHLGKVILRDIWVKYGELNLPLPEKFIIGQVLPNAGS